MRHGIWISLTVIVAVNAVVAAQAPTLGAPEQIPVAALTAGDAVNRSCSAGAGCVESALVSTRRWAQVEYLLWWMRGNQIPPLTTLGDQADATPGAIGQAGTVRLLDDRMGYDASSGGRIALGAWLGSDSCWGWEAKGFLFERDASSFSRLSPAGDAANPSLHVPGLNANTGAETASVPLTAFAAASRLRLWGAEVNLLRPGRQQGAASVDLVAGFRYLNLNESLSLIHVAEPGGNSLQVGADDFHTRNSFYGGQLGAKVSWGRDHWILDVTGKVALGGNHRVLNVNGITLVDGVPAFAGAIFTAPSNIGRFHDDTFAVLPEVQVNLGYELTRHVRLLAGYNFLYLSNVARAGESIDRVVLGATPPRPQPHFGNADFWAHGINFTILLSW